MFLDTPTDGRNNARVSSTFDMLRKDGKRRDCWIIGLDDSVNWPANVRP